MGQQNIERCAGNQRNCETLTVDFASLLSGQEGPTSDDLYTVEELCEETGWGSGKVRRRLKAAIKEGKCTTGQKQIESINGVRRTTVAYKLGNDSTQKGNGE